jgi:two-component system, NtrC family, sensor histidine kinase HydH
MLLVTGVSSALLLASSVAVAVYLKSQQAQTAEVLGENIGSRRAAANLREILTDLVALHQSGATDMGPLHERVQTHLTEIKRLADKETEKVLARRVTDSFGEYLALWRSRDTRPEASAEAVRHLVTDTIPICEKLREFNSHEIETSELDHRRTLRWLTWGFVAVGVLGSVGGLLLGYALARGLQRAVDSLLVHIRGASDMLGQELATVEWQRNGLPVQDGVADLTQRVEQVVRQLQQREREVRRSERLAAVGQLAAGVAHEIRNPLTSVQLLVQTARKDPSAGALTESDLAMIDDELGRIERSLKTFIDYARPPKLERVKCDLAAIIESGLNLIRGRADQQAVDIHFASPTDPITLDADTGQLRQVVVNLLLNALDAMATGGTLEILTRRDGVSAEFAVTDTGAGISSEIFPRLFEPFASAKETGLGLGLVVCKRIVEDHGGTLRGFNRPERGAAFVVQLPRSASPALVEPSA